MGRQNRLEKRLYEQASVGNVDAIKTLHQQGAGLEWNDREGRTALIVACMEPELYDVARTLIQLGANVNHYCPGRGGGTPLHHAARRDFVPTVDLLLARRANAFRRNDDDQTPLDVARNKGYIDVVRAIEGHMDYQRRSDNSFYVKCFWPCFGVLLLAVLLRLMKLI
ncbi:putative E3 ubiquitin-protein ligase XBAT35 [Lycium barbarum]|uniref:putative E3 ubiquitin-protein ligase XBAT35 n=1 Tax=Lycium barbarum TaxID=112863 RepID=UPI00293EAF7F|nr:putative E3 ubiquitin-protein ligase XBAT35 [Lycium barbarum]